MHLGQQLLPLGVDYDNSPQYIPKDSAFFLKGIETTWEIVGGKAQNSNELKPAESNYLYCSVVLPVGDNTVVGYYYYAEENAGYVVVHNSNKEHFIYRIKGDGAACEVVYRFCKEGDIAAGIVNEPRYFFSKGRIAIKSLCRYLPDGTSELYKEMALVNKKMPNIRIVIEDSIATNSFTTPFFNKGNNCCGDTCRIIKTGLATPMQQIKIIPIPVTAGVANKQNRMFNQIFQFRIREENAWGKVSEYGLISDKYNNTLAGCSTDASSQPSCVWLELNTPCPEIVKITVAVRSCFLRKTLSSDGNILSGWKDAYTVDLYDKTSPSLKWFDRVYDRNNPDLQFLNSDKKIRLRFCNDRECKNVALANVRNMNPAPHNSGSVAVVGNGLAYADNENDLPAFPKTDIESVKLEIVEQAGCKIKYQRIKVWMAVHNYDNAANQPVYSFGETTGFGGFGNIVPGLGLGSIEFVNPLGDEGSFNDRSGYGQKFPNGIKGFRAILAGTKYTAESKQFLKVGSEYTEIGAMNLSEADLRKYVVEKRNEGGLFLQCFDFGLVPQGPYYFRMMGHSDNEVDSLKLEKTSTYYRETTTFSGYTSAGVVNQNFTKEILIDTTNGQDYDSIVADKLAIVQDITYPGDNGYCVRGYLYENRDSLIPVELAEVRKTRGDDYVVGLSDHNGFYWWTTQYGGDYKLQLKGSRKCNYGTLLGQTETKREWGTTKSPDLFITDRIPTYSTELCNRYLVKGKIQECNTNAGIAGVAVILGRSAPAITNSQGEFTIIAHYFNGRGIDKLIVSVSGSCDIVDCNCNPVSIKLNIQQPACVDCNEQSRYIGAFSLKTITGSGWPFGMRTQIGLIGHKGGLITPIQTSEKLFVNFPTEQEKGNSFHSLLKVTLPDSFSDFICKNFDRVTLAWSKNTNYEDWVDWAADQVQFIDSAGNVNTVSPSKVKIWYRSLNQYNVLRGLNTNTVWTIKDENENSRVGDIVEFIQNADGKYLPPNIEASVEYDKEGTYFLVDYSNSLKDLKDGVKFKLKRPYVCETNKTFYEYFLPLNFCTDCKPRNDDGQIVKEIIMGVVASYNINRQIPVVKDVVSIVDSVEVTTQVKTIKVYPFTFEHHSPSDTWGDHCNNGGRVNGINPYEGKKCDRTQILLTGALNQSNDGAINYLDYFSLDDEFVLDEKGFGSITALLVRDDGQMLIICGLTCFTLRYNDDRAVVTADGYIQVPTNRRFSRPDRNPSFNFGCQPADVNTIGYKDSIAWFLDSQRQAIVLHDFSQAVDVSIGIQSWLAPSIKMVKANPDKMYWHFGYDRRLGKIYVTKFVAGQYVNNELAIAIDKSETIAYNIRGKRWTQSNFTPEYYGEMDGDGFDLQFFSFQNALAWAHHNSVNPSPVYLNYFNVQCIPIIGVVTNAEGAAEKTFASNEIYCRQRTFDRGLFILESLETSLNQKSQGLSGNWEYGGGRSYSAYLCDTENIDYCEVRQDALFDGDCLMGRWLKALYIPNPVYNGEYFEITQIVSFYYLNSNGSQ